MEEGRREGQTNNCLDSLRRRMVVKGTGCMDSSSQLTLTLSWLEL